MQSHAMQVFDVGVLVAQVLQQLAAKVEETVFLKMADLQLQLYSTAVHKSRRELATFRIGQDSCCCCPSVDLI